MHASRCPTLRRWLSLVALATLLGACARDGTPPPEGDPPASELAQDAFEFLETDLSTLQARMADGALDSRTLTQAYLSRMDAIDVAGPTLRAVIARNPDAIAEASALDEERRAGHVRGPLHGIPVLLKDNIDAMPMATTAGSLALAAHRPRRDAFLVTRLRDAGAVILGKTNLSEWANFRSTRSTSGWSALGGQTRNPYVLDRSPCGSSSGSGSAVAASLAAVAIGTETDGSILCPAAVAGLVGIKPTVGLVSRHGIVPISHSQDTAGPMARTVADAALVLAAIAGHDPHDPASVARGNTGYTTRLRNDALQGARIGILRHDRLGQHPDVDAAYSRALETLRALGAETVEATIATTGRWNAAEYEVLLHEFKEGLERYLEDTAAPYRSLASLIDFNNANADRQMPYFGQEIFEQSQAKGPLTDAAYLDARRDALRLARTEGIEAALREHRLDALVVPTTGPAWTIDPRNGDHFPGAGYGVAAVAGTPSITVPMGDAHGLPLGLAFLGPAWSEAQLIGFAHAFEQATRARQPPRFLPSLSAGGESTVRR